LTIVPNGRRGFSVSDKAQQQNLMRIRPKDMANGGIDSPLGHMY